MSEYTYQFGTDREIKSCRDCPEWHLEISDGFNYCILTYARILKAEIKPSWCPLRRIINGKYTVAESEAEK